MAYSDVDYSFHINAVDILPIIWYSMSNVALVCCILVLYGSFTQYIWVIVGEESIHWGAVAIRESDGACGDEGTCITSGVAGRLSRTVCSTARTSKDLGPVPRGVQLREARAATLVWLIKHTDVRSSSRSRSGHAQGAS